MSSVLVLDKSWSPVEFSSVFDALVKVYKNKMRILDHDYQMHTWESWIDTWSDAAKLAQQTEIIHSVDFAIAAPEVVVLTDYTATKFRKRAKLSRKNIFIRDNYTCQYCRKTFKPKFLNIDHVVPKAQGGKTRWKNLVLSCMTCNQNKGSRTPEQAGMHLIRKPFEPKWYTLHDQVNRKTLDSWSGLFGSMYWNVTLQVDK